MSKRSSRMFWFGFFVSLIVCLAINEVHANPVNSPTFPWVIVTSTDALGGHYTVTVDGSHACSGDANFVHVDSSGSANANARNGDWGCLPPNPFTHEYIYETGGIVTSPDQCPVLPGSSASSCTPAVDLLCPTGFTYAQSFCRTCPAGQLVFDSSVGCQGACAHVGGNDNTARTIAVLKVQGDWTQWMAANKTGALKQKVYGISSDGGALPSTDCGVVIFGWDFSAQDDCTTIATLGWTGLSPGASAVYVDSIRGSSTHAAGSPTCSGTSPQGVYVLNPTGDAGNPVTVTGSVSINGTPTVSVPGGVAVTSLPAITGTVSITGTPSVSVTGTANVAITGTPNVNIGTTGQVTLRNGGSAVSGTNPLPVSIIGGSFIGTQSVPSVVAAQTGNGDGTGGTVCCDAGSVVGLRSWPSTVQPLYTPVYADWGDAVNAMKATLGASSLGWVNAISDLSFTPSGNYHGGCPVIPLDMSQHIFGGGLGTVQIGLPCSVWPYIQVLVELMTAIVVIGLVIG